jgi:FkbM family methyltransferase
MTISVAIIDVIGLTYDGSTLSKRGLGGSESAVILQSRELARLGFDVTVFNNCVDSHATPGVYDGVRYVDLSELHKPNYYKADIVISSRTVIPFLPEQHWGIFNYPGSVFQQLKHNAKIKIVWMHDTFCSGDHLLEDMVVAGDIDYLFTLSDFHTTYVSNCTHGKRRNFEVLKNRIFQTRNGITVYHDQVDIAAKDPHLYVYNASVTKGMIPLLTKIWHRVKQQIPEAKLKIIGGYYRFRDGCEPDEQEKKFWDLANSAELRALDVEFTGIIKQSEIAEILAKSSFMIYPGAFPETFGISSLESLCYNTPLITTRFGALEETAIEACSYFIDYAIEPNVLFEHINAPAQETKFVQAVVDAHKNRYLHQQKMYQCNLIKGICTWDTVALQWKQFFYNKLGAFLSADEYRTVSALNNRVHQVFGRRFSNPVEWGHKKLSTEQRIIVISPFFNSENYLRKCIWSVAQQDYQNYHHYLIDDCSTDSGYEVCLGVIAELPADIKNKFTLIKNKQNQGAVCNQVSNIRQHDPDAIIMLLDGDDWLINNNTIFDLYNDIYAAGAEFTYGSCWSVVDDIPLIAQPYPEQVKQDRSYRSHRFNWNMPYPHLRTFRKKLLDELPDSVFKDTNGEWYGAGGDNAVFYHLIEQADPDAVVCVPDVMYCYNDTNPLNDYKVNAEEQNLTASAIISGSKKITKSNKKIVKEKQIKSPETAYCVSDKVVVKAAVKKILIAIPTAKYIESETFKSIYNLIIPDGYETEFQFFYGYSIDQIRNLIAHWAAHYDYLFSVDSDMAFPPDTLSRMLNHNVDMVSGLYIQRKPGEQIVEVYEPNAHGGVSNIPWERLRGRELMPIAGCGFGCVLIKSEVIRAVGYPQFVYHSALDHAHTISEDVDFCRKVNKLGYQIFADTSILCDHIGNTVFRLSDSVQQHEPQPAASESALTRHFRNLQNYPMIPDQHVKFLEQLSSTVRPNVIYDIGAQVGCWASKAKSLWPYSNIILFDAMPELQELYEQDHEKYHIGLLSSTDGRDVKFYKNTMLPGGNSYYKENKEFSKDADVLFPDDAAEIMETITLDTLIRSKNLPLPDLIKIDVQGAELDVLKGAQETLSHVQHLIVELQYVEYNVGAPSKQDVVDYLESQGFKLAGLITETQVDGDYYFVKSAG